MAPPSIYGTVPGAPRVETRSYVFPAPARTAGLADEKLLDAAVAGMRDGCCLDSTTTSRVCRDYVEVAATLEHTTEELAKERSARSDLASDLEDARADVADLKQQLASTRSYYLGELSGLRARLNESERAATPTPQRYTATYERLTVSLDMACQSIAGASYKEVNAKLTASVVADRLRLVDAMSCGRVPPPLPCFDLSDCDDAIVIDLPVLP
jgi:hypothetical protein